MAFLLCVGFSDLGGMRQHWYCVAHPLTRRYVLWRKKWKFAQTRSVGKHLKFLSLAQALLVVKS
ncbi:hypothetical protein AB3A93_004559 [Vibrio parahaemolyticus]|nr:hypothetical protein [Vibrio parahaemolyticus]